MLQTIDLFLGLWKERLTFLSVLERLVFISYFRDGNNLKTALQLENLMVGTLI